MAGESLGRRMLCATCARTDAPDTWVAGSDLLELVLWCLFLVPGLLYCWWRHLQRRRVCRHCGSPALVRESRASRHRSREDPRVAPAEAPAAPRGEIVYAARHIAWMDTPSRRFRRATRGSAVLAAAGAAFAVVSMNTVQVVRDPDAASLRPPPTEAELEQQREERVKDRRQLECERLCSEFHRAKARSHRSCMESCAAKLFEDGRGDEPAGGCGDLLDPSTCDFVSGRTPAAVRGDADTPVATPPSPPAGP